MKSIEDTNNAITIITIITAVIFLTITTVFAFFLSSRITKPLRRLRDQATRVSEGDYFINLLSQRKMKLVNYRRHLIR